MTKLYNGRTVEELAKIAHSKRFGCNFPNAAKNSANAFANWDNMQPEDRDDWREIAQAVAEVCSPRWIAVESGDMSKTGEFVNIYGINRRDGKYFVTMGIYAGKHQLCCDDQDYHGDADYDEVKDKEYWPEGWYEGARDEETLFKMHSVTHWAPLLLPPQPPQQGDV